MVLALWPFAAFDNVHVLLLGGVELVLIASAVFLLPRHRAHIAVLLLAGALACVTGEVYFRIAWFGPTGLDTRQFRPAGYYHPAVNIPFSADTYTGNAPGSESMFKGAELSINAHGFRGPSYPYAANGNPYRIVLAGSSISVGAGVPDNAVYSRLLQDRLNAAGTTRPVEIINLSISASRYGNILHAIEHVGLRYLPDALMMIVNKPRNPQGTLELGPSPRKRYTGTPARLFTDRTFEYFSNHFFFANLLRAERRRQFAAVKQLLHARSRPEDGAGYESPLIRDALSRLRRVAGDRPVVLLLLKPVARLGDDSHDMGFRRFVKAMAAGYGMCVVDTYEMRTADAREVDLIIYPGDPHPSAQAHCLYADFILARLADCLHLTY